MIEETRGRTNRPPTPPHTTHPTPPLYRSYLLRLWSGAGTAENRDWHASLESPLTQDQSHFPDLDSLFAFLRTTATAEPADDLAVHESLPEDNIVVEDAEES